MVFLVVLVSMSLQKAAVGSIQRIAHPIKESDNTSQSGERVK
jgi:hypothetical protein